MKKILILLSGVILANALFAQGTKTPPQTQIMTLGVFHLAYHNLDVQKTKKKDQISVLEEPYQSEIIAICNAIETFKPTIIAIERTPNEQGVIDSLFSLYKSDQFKLKKDEIFQLAFRMGKKLNLPKIHCVNDWGKHYNDMETLFKDSIRAANFESYYFQSPDSIYMEKKTSKQVSNIIDEFIQLNNPKKIKESLSVYLLNPFKYEEKAGDFAGVDFETGRWFNRNLRIFRNLQRVAQKPEERILLIIGSGHLNLLNMFLDVSKEFDLVSPLPYLENAKMKTYTK
ncbi:hypothetical protein EO244_00090 [Ancylomarina salipaludis]|uniref:TraB/GumN family protein n=1 Tax=Ancylomarina salipaludis TaxID=2501299 RepID=A0A4Q1JR08_9BACT|nr:DUF5694 domain-containing protein [Ancylomarina salipaludis]RXQ97331.1 hypothetical protein EO244_00090 [Ancylomarina salipaludis]